MDEHLLILRDTVTDLVAADSHEAALAALDGLRAQDVSALLVAVEPEVRRKLSDLLAESDCDKLAHALWELDSDRPELLSETSDEVASRIIDLLPDHGATDILSDVEAPRRTALLDRLSADRASRLRTLLGHADQTAGSLMSTDFVSVVTGSRVSELIEVLRAHPKTAFAYYVYVLDSAGRLRGITSLRDVVIAAPDTVVDSLIKPDTVCVPTFADQEEVAVMASRYDLMAIPVIGPDGRMLGIVTADEVLEVLSEEADEDIEKFAGSVDEAERRSLWLIVKARLPWVFGTFIVELAAAIIFLRPLPAASTRVLLAFLPLLLLTGGGSASASAGAMLRRMVERNAGLARLFVREVQGAVLLALIAVVSSLGVLELAGQDRATSRVVSLTVGLTVFGSSIVGAAAPVVLQAAKRDPALASGPLLGSIADASALFVYLVAARLLLH